MVGRDENERGDGTPDVAAPLDVENLFRMLEALDDIRIDSTVIRGMLELATSRFES